MANLGRQNRRAALLQQVKVSLRGEVLVHMLLHRGHEQQGSRGCKRHGGQHIVGHAVSQLGERVGGRRCDDEQVGLAPEFDVACGSLAGRLPELRIDWAMAQRREGQGADELLGMLCEHNVDECASLLELARQVGSLVRGDTATNAENDPFILQHGSAYPRIVRQVSNTAKSPKRVLRAVKMGYARGEDGNVQLSHRASPAVSSGLEGLTTVFGMGTGVPPPL